VRVAPIALILAGASFAAAEPATLEPISARSIGRAGVGVVSDDGGLATLINPAAIARRGQARLALGLRFSAIETDIDRGEAVTRDQSGPALGPGLAFAWSPSRRWVVAAAVVETISHRRRYPAPAFDQPAADVAALYPFRYGGLAANGFQLSASAGAAVRATDWLAAGAALRISRIEMLERRSIWAGLEGRDLVGSPERDLLLTLSADAPLRAGGAVGLLAAPIDVPIEIAMGAAFDAPVELDGRAELEAMTADGTAPVPGPEVATSLEVPGRVTLATGLRYLAPRLAIELDARFTGPLGGSARRWQIEGLEVTDESGAVARLDEVPSLLGSGRHFAVQAAAELAAIDGFLWITAGYGFQSPALSGRERSPLLLAPPIHRLAAGIEALWSGFTISAGYSRELSPTVSTDFAESGVAIISPFNPVTVPATQGRYRRSNDLGALWIEYAWD
jgi:hypothetical protein